MNDKFTVEEVNLICIFECKSRTKVISDIKKAIKHLDDGEMVELSNRVVAKLNNMTDKELRDEKRIKRTLKFYPTQKTCKQSEVINQIYCK